MENRNLRSEPGCPEAKGPTPLLRGIFFVLSCFVILSLVLSLDDNSRAQVGAAGEEPDFTDIFRQIDARLEQSYLDLGRVKPRPLVERALSSLELAADEIYVEAFDDSRPYATLHVGNKVKVLDLQGISTRTDSVRLLESVFDFLSRHYRGDTPLNDLRYAAANGYLSGIDPHTLVFTPRSFEEFEVHIKGEIFGVGMMVGSTASGKLEVKQVLQGTPAFHAGFQKDDMIAKIDDASTINMTVMEAVQKIRGPKDSEVVLTVKRQSKTDKDKLDTIDIAVKRDRVIIKSVESKLIGEEGAKDGFGYIKVTNFDQKTGTHLLRNLARLDRQNGGPLAGLILDFRGNSGGLLTQAIGMCDAFLKKGDIVVTAKKGDRLYRTPARDEKNEPEYPIIMLADEQSASGAEIVLGALQKNGRGIVLGTQSFGKGSVQQLQGLSHGAQLKITVSEYLIPGDISIQETGVTPDIFAQRVLLEDDYTNLYASGRQIGEADYETHIVSKYARDEEPSYRLKYMRNAVIDKDGPTASERFISGELNPESDALVQMALEIFPLFDKPYDTKKLLSKNKKAFDKLHEKYEAQIVKHLEGLGIDWSAGDGAIPGENDISADVTSELIQEPSKDKEDLVKVNKLLIRVKVKNRGEKTIYRLKGRSRSDYHLYEDREFLFGKLAPGESIERQVKIVVPYFPRAQNDQIDLDFSCDKGAAVLTASTEFVLPLQGRPVFAYSSTLLDAKGQKTEKLAIADDYKIRLKIKNIGKGPAHKGVAILRNKSGREIFLKEGRLEFAELGTGGEQEVEFRFDVRKAEGTSPFGKTKESDEAYKFELVIYDSYSGENITRKIEIGRAGDRGPKFPNGKLFDAPMIDIVLSVNDKPGVLVTEQEQATISASISTSAPNYKAWVTNLPLSMKSGLPDKVYFKTSSGETDLAVKADINLSDGLNLVTVVVKDSRGIQQRRSVMIRKKSSNKVSSKR